MKRGRFRRILLPGSVAMVLAAIVVGLTSLGGSASAVETAPENTAAPTVNPLLPIRGDMETASQGSWTGSPTSFTYAWYRCKGLESCVSIVGASNSSYTPVTADVGSRLRVLVTATNGAGTGSALSAATSVVVGSAYWYSCSEVGGTSGGFEDSACTKAAKGPFEWTKVTTGTSTSLKLSGGKPIVFGWTTAGISTTISCSSQSGSGSLENPAGGSAGIITGLTVKFSGCTVTKPVGRNCVVNSGSITTVSLSGTPAEPEGKPVVKFQPSSGTTLFTVPLEGCIENKPPAANYAFTGSLQGRLLTPGSSLEFDGSSGSSLSVGGSPGFFESTMKIETSTGRSLKLIS